MSMTMQQPLSYPFHADPRRFPFPMPWSSVPFQPPYSHQQRFPSSYPVPQPLPPFVLSQQRKLPPSSSYSNTRYHHLKQSTSHSNRRPVYRSLDASTHSQRYPTYNDSIPTHQYRPSKAKSVSDFKQVFQSTSTPLPKAHSWHTMANHHPSNMSVTYAKEMQLTPKRRRKHSPRKKTNIQPQRHLSSSPLKRKPSFNHRRKRPMRMPERGVVRISTLDELPIANNQTSKSTNSINNDRLSTKGSISNSSKRRIIPTEKSKEKNSIKNRKIQNNDGVDEGTRVDSDTQSTSSTQSYSSLQQRLNGSLRNDPLIIAAMEDYRELHRTSSQTTILSVHRRDLSRDSLYSHSTFHPSPSPSSSSLSNNQSQSSFTSLERSEIRRLIKTTKTKDRKSSPIRVSTPSSEQSITTNSHPPVPIIKSKRSDITEELDNKFNKLRALDPDGELFYVTPSSICKQKKINEKPYQTIPPLPTFDELLRQVQLRPIDKSVRSISPPPKENSVHDENDYENPLLSIPVPRSSPIPTDEIKPNEPKHEYAIPIKKNEGKSLPQISHFQPIRNFKFNKPISNLVSEKRSSRSLSMFNWFHNGSTNTLPTTFQPDRIINNQNEYGTTSVQENIYTSDIDVYVPLPISDKNENDSLQIHLDNQTILTDDFYSDYETNQTTNSSSILNDFSHLFTRKHKQQNNLHKKTHRCSIM